MIACNLTIFVYFRPKCCTQSRVSSPADTHRVELRSTFFKWVPILQDKYLLHQILLHENSLWVWNTSNKNSSIFSSNIDLFGRFTNCLVSNKNWIEQIKFHFYYRILPIQTFLTLVQQTSCKVQIGTYFDWWILRLLQQFVSWVDHVSQGKRRLKHLLLEPWHRIWAMVTHGWCQTEIMEN